MNITVDPKNRLDVLQRFLRELLGGRRDPVVTRAFVSVGANSLVSYPLCYVKEIFTLLSHGQSVKVLLEILQKLENHLRSKHSGIAWECTVQVAIILRMLEATWFGSQGPFELVPEETNPNLDFRTLPDEINTLEGARDFINAIIGSYKSPTLIYVVGANACFPAVEGFMVYTNACPDGVKIVGFQMKTGDVKPRKAIDTGVINGGAVLIRGRALAKNPREPKAGWRYMTSKQVRDFVGNSLLLAMPRDWLQDQLIV